MIEFGAARKRANLTILRNHQMLQNDRSVAKIGFGASGNRRSKVWMTNLPHTNGSFSELSLKQLSVSVARWLRRSPEKWTWQSHSPS